jgi:hypothetical protein
MSLAECAAYIWSHLNSHGIQCVLSGGACVSIYCSNRYQSFDLDFVENITTDRNLIRKALAEIDFYEENRYFKHPDTPFIVEFPTGPLSIGSEPVKEIVMFQFSTGKLALLSATDCVKDRLAAYYHWNDLQCLEQALMVALENNIDLDEVERWSKVENKYREFIKIKDRFKRG